MKLTVKKVERGSHKIQRVRPILEFDENERELLRNLVDYLRVYADNHQDDDDLVNFDDAVRVNDEDLEILEDLSDVLDNYYSM